MKALRKGNTGTEVRVLQGWLEVLGYYNGVIDGSFGNATELAVKVYQGAHRLVVDGSCGPATQKEMGLLPVKNSKIMVLRIPFSIIDRAGVLLKDKQAYSVSKLAKEFNMNVVVNAGFFDMRTRQNTTDLITNGKLNNGGNYTDKGLAFGKDFRNIGIYPSTTSNSVGNAVDFMGGCPVLIQNGKKDVDMKGIGNSLYTSRTRRTCTGVTKDAFYILISLQNCNLEEMVQEGLNQKLLFLKGNDGGGSQSLFLGSDTVIFTDGRAIPSAEGLYVRKETIKPPTFPTPPNSQPVNYKIAIDSGHSELSAGKRSFDNSFFEYEFNMDVSQRIKKHLNRHGVESKIFQVKNKNSVSEMYERIKQINAYNPRIVVSIHANAFGEDWNTANGWEIYYSKGSAGGKRLAECIHSTSIPFLGLTDRGVKDTRTLAMVRRPYAPSVLIEHGFMTNKVECELLKSDDFRNKCAIADAKGILKYLNIEWIEEETVDYKKLYKNTLSQVEIQKLINKQLVEKLDHIKEIINNIKGEINKC